tara:strand:+ start:1300 stop:1851 length:552 start_codon:yes stop_codon:yes gene_type:complete
MSKNCKSTELYNPIIGKCVPKMTSKPMSTTETVGISTGGILLGALAGWVLAKSQGDTDEDFEQEIETDALIDQYELTDFIPNLNSLDLDNLSDRQVVIINNFIAKGVVRRLENIDDVDSFEEVFSDLVVLQDLIIKESNYEELSLDSQSQIQMLTSQIDNIQEILSFYENIDDMIDVMNELGE